MGLANQMRRKSKLHMYDSMYTKVKSVQNYSVVKEIRTVASSQGWMGRLLRGIKNLVGDRKVLHLGKGVGYTGVRICQNSLNCVHLSYVQLTVFKLY